MYCIMISCQTLRLRNRTKHKIVELVNRVSRYVLFHILDDRLKNCCELSWHD